jgi:transposase
MNRRDGWWAVVAARLDRSPVGFPSYRRDIALKEVMAMERRSFDREFREGAVRIVRMTGKPIAQVARELGPNEGTLGRWVNLDRRTREGEGPFSQNERDELNRLRKENAELATERRLSEAARNASTM